jgi:hypothetical protein
MDDTALIEELQQKVREAEELLRRRKEALAALKGKSVASRRGRRQSSFRAGSVPALAHAVLRSAKQQLSLDELVTHLRKTNPSLDARKVSIALSRYVRLGQHFFQTEEGKYGIK